MGIYTMMSLHNIQFNDNLKSKSCAFEVELSNLNIILQLPVTMKDQ